MQALNAKGPTCLSRPQCHRGWQQLAEPLAAEWALAGPDHCTEPFMGNLKAMSLRTMLESPAGMDLRCKHGASLRRGRSFAE